MNKISIAIIDDESLVRLGIKSSVEWENYGYEIIGEADNGQNGLEMIQQKQPISCFWIFVCRLWME